MDGGCSKKEQQQIITIPERKKRWKHCFFLFPALVSVVLSIGYLVWFYRIRQISYSPDIERIRPIVRNGDVILRSGIGLWSGLFRSRNTVDKRFSHVGIIRIKPNGSIYVIHAEGDDLSGSGRVFEEPLEHFIGKSDKIGIGRLRIGDHDQFVNNAMTFLGRPFDWKFNKDDNSAVYCTELIDLSLRKMKPQLHLPEHKGLLLPESCLYPKLFIEIPVSL